MGNKIKYNLKNVHAAVLTETTTSNPWYGNIHHG